MPKPKCTGDMLYSGSAVTETAVSLTDCDTLIFHTVTVNNHAHFDTRTLTVCNTVNNLSHCLWLSQQYPSLWNTVNTLPHCHKTAVMLPSTMFTGLFCTTTVSMRAESISISNAQPATRQYICFQNNSTRYETKMLGQTWTTIICGLYLAMPFISQYYINQACQTCGPLQAHLRPAQRIL
jgi:hypothetical protein